MTVQKDLKERLIDDIEKLPAHTKLPSRTELSAQYYVSRQTMDVVINTLCREGYLYALRGAAPMCGSRGQYCDGRRTDAPHYRPGAAYLRH